MPPHPTFTLGIEEEFQVIDPATRELKSHIHELFAEGEKRLAEEIKREMHDAVIEVGTPICTLVFCATARVGTDACIGKVIDAQNGRVVRIFKDLHHVVFEYQNADGQTLKEQLDNTQLYQLQQRYAAGRADSDLVATSKT